MLIKSIDLYNYSLEDFNNDLKKYSTEKNIVGEFYCLSLVFFKSKYIVKPLYFSLNLNDDKYIVSLLYKRMLEEAIGTDGELIFVLYPFKFE